MKNDITDLFGIEFPIFAFSHCRDVVAAVTKAGGLGVLGAVAHTDEQLEIDLDWIEAEIGDLPYGVDLIIPARYLGEEEGGYSAEQVERLIPAEQRAFVDDILQRYAVPDLPDHRRPADASSRVTPCSRPTAPPHNWRSPSPTEHGSS